MILVTNHMSGAGNAFVVLDSRTPDFPMASIKDLVPALCNRSSMHMPTAEGVIVLDSVAGSTAHSTFFNPDGSTGAMCGNGGRCLVRFALDRGGSLDAHDRFVFTMAGTTYSATQSEGAIICVTFPAPLEITPIAPNEIVGMPGGGTYVNVGSDHVVIRTQTLESDITLANLPINTLAPPIRHNPRFPRGVNVNFASVDADGTVYMRTFERGVEGETGACGTGAISTAVALWQDGLVPDEVALVPTSGKRLKVLINHLDHDIQHVTLCGDAVYDTAALHFDTTTGSYL